MKQIAILINHYESHSEYSGESRYRSWALKLISEGYEVYIICSSVLHSQNIDILSNGEKSRIINDDGINYVYVKTNHYKSNSGIDRIVNMIGFYFSATKAIKNLPIPSFIISRSPNPLACVVGLQHGKKNQVPCICDIVDLWPESIAVYQHISKKNILMRLLYKGEKWIYKHSSALIFSVPGAYDYIIERHWDKVIPEAKVFYINMGIDLEANDRNRDLYSYPDIALDRKDLFKVVYTGSVRLVNNLKLLCDAGLEIQKRGFSNISIMIHGAGDQVAELQQYCQENHINNVKLYGRIEKKQIPYVLAHSDLCVLCYQNTPLLRFGGSMNKMFDYFASGKPIISNAKMGHSIIEKYHCGVELSSNDPIILADEIIRFYSMSVEEREEYGKRSRQAAEDYDSKILCQHLIEVINRVQTVFHH